MRSPGGDSSEFSEKRRAKINHRDHRGKQRARRHRNKTRESVEGGAEFEDAGADGFDGNGEGEGGGFVEKKDDAVEFAFADAAGKGETDGMEEVAAADFEFLFQFGDDFLETVRGEGGRIEKEQGEMADDVPGSITREGGVGVGGLEDPRGVEFEDEAEEIGEAFARLGVMAK